MIAVVLGGRFWSAHHIKKNPSQCGSGFRVCGFSFSFLAKVRIIGRERCLRHHSCFVSFFFFVSSHDLYVFRQRREAGAHINAQRIVYVTNFAHYFRVIIKVNLQFSSSIYLPFLCFRCACRRHEVNERAFG